MQPPAASSDRQYWEERAEAYGSQAAGYRNPAMSRYEERLRWSAIRRCWTPGSGQRVLDAGCGVGLWSVRLAGAGCSVLAVDISPTMLAMAEAAPGVEYRLAAIQDLDLPDHSFDALLSVTVLQHITHEDEFDQALDNLTRLLRPGGAAIVLEFAPWWRRGREPAHMRYRTRSEWIHAFRSRGYRKARESGVRFLGHGLYLGLLALRAKVRPDAPALDGNGHPVWPVAAFARTMGWAADLTVGRLPLLSLLSNVRVFVFEKPAA